MSVELCDKDHYAILFKILHIFPQILKKAPVTYSVHGGKAIIKQLEENAYYIPNTDFWDSYDYDLHSPDIQKLADYIIRQIEHHTTIRSDQIVKTHIVEAGGRHGIQLALNVCNIIPLPQELGSDKHTHHALQFADIFEPPPGLDFDDVDIYDGVKYEKPPVLARNLQQSIRLYLEQSVHMPDVTHISFNEIIKGIKYEINSTMEYYDILLQQYVNACRARSTKKHTLNTLKQELDEHYELIIEYHELLADRTSYNTVNEFILQTNQRIERYNKLNKLRIRLELVRELLISQNQD